MGIIEERIRESIKVKEKILNDTDLINSIKEAADMIFDCLNNGGKVMFCGNGGSASDALHLTGELVGRFQKDRQSMAAICLNADVATMTSLSNDYGYDLVFARSVEGLMKPEDILVGISTSGNSENVYQGILSAKKIGGKTIALLGKTGGKIRKEASISIIIPCDVTARIQEAHITIGHIICEIVEDRL